MPKYVIFISNDMGNKMLRDKPLSPVNALVRSSAWPLPAR